MFASLQPYTDWEVCRWNYNQICTVTEELMQKIDYHQNQLLDQPFNSGRYINSWAKLEFDLLPALDKIQAYVNTLDPKTAREFFPMFFS